MPASSDNLHGCAPATCAVALLMIDVINDLEFEEGDQLLRFATPMAQRIAELKRRAQAAGVPIVYVNDNFGHWRSDFSATVKHCINDGVRGEAIARLLSPDQDDYFVLKPKHSGFFSTTLETLLKSLEVRTLILVGLAGNICVLFTANDAYMRDYKLVIPGDCVASNTVADNEMALTLMQTLLKADTQPSAQVDFRNLMNCEQS